MYDEATILDKSAISESNRRDSFHIRLQWKPFSSKHFSNGLFQFTWQHLSNTNQTHPQSKWISDFAALNFFYIPERWKKHICMSNLSNIFKQNTDYLMCMQSIRIIYNAFIVISLPHSRLLNLFRSNRLCQSLWHTCIHFHMYKIK